ncbi:unnamed protein product [Chondrus crispus]|uniref:Uncharacterized protein n=1 Tax=Chondrus crispus TaxID=2769 RepID=R7QEA5_CHOCR|nr:unnamed protein product [Chondrus crispus]CDF36083.1 unnamed protein product [Chondrus crispus]|eukprot:XP_005715902.1 unnamed protein product [Chondrus crispus]
MFISTPTRNRSSTVRNRPFSTHSVRRGPYLECSPHRYVCDLPQCRRAKSSSPSSR